MNTERPDDASDAAEVTGISEGAAPPRRRSPLVVASVAAAVLLAGGGGAYLAATASGGSTPGGGDTSPALALDGYGGGGSRPGRAPGGPDGAAPSAPKGSAVTVLGYITEGTDLTVTYQGGVCADYSAFAKESAGQVTVTVTETPWRGKVCIMIAKVYRRTLHLTAPLGDRDVVGPDGKQIPRETADTLPPAAPGGPGTWQRR